MQDIATTAKSYLDFAGLGQLKAKASKDQASAAQEVGRQFEAMFVQMIFKSVREANDTMKSDLMGSSSVDTFEQMYHDELSQVMAQKGVFGLGDWLADQVNGKPNAEKVAKAYEQALPQAMPLNKPAEPKSMSLGVTDIKKVRELNNG